MIIDPYFNRQYSQFCYTFQYLPGKTTYLDTPVVPVAAFAGPGQFPLDCEYADGTPMIYSVEGKTAGGVSQSGPYVPRPPTSCTATSTATCPTLTLVSAGMVDVPNPAYDGTAATSPTIPRDFGFGATQGTVRFNGADSCRSRAGATTSSKCMFRARSPPATPPAGSWNSPRQRPGHRDGRHRHDRHGQRHDRQDRRARNEDPGGDRCAPIRAT